MKVLLCTIVKNENKYLQEFIEYYKAIGISTICIYDNNNLEGEKVDIKDPQVIIKDVRGIRPCQFECYESCYNEFKKDYDWICFFDCDEFLYINNHNCKNINDYLSLSCFNNYDIIKINWKLYGDSNILDINNNYSIKRFENNPIFPYDFKVRNNQYPQNYHCKVIVRCKDINLIWKNPHIPYNQLSVCDNKGEKSNISPFNTIDYTYSELRHFYTKTIDEYILKIDRGWGDRSKDLSIKELELFINDFFYYNEKTLEKVKRIEDYMKKKKEELLKIYVCTHKDFDTSVVPKICHQVIYNHECDNYLDNIEQVYSEGYQIYDCYINQPNNEEFIGICHYRRYFNDSVENLISYMNDNDCIVSERVDIGQQTVYEQYKNTFNEEDIKVIGAIIKKYYPDFLDSYCNYFNNTCLYPYNMFIMKRDDFYDYCKFSFDILDRFCKYHHWNNTQDVYDYVKENKDKFPNFSKDNLDDYFKTIEYNSRICGNILERLLGVYITKKFNKIKEVPIKLIS